MRRDRSRFPTARDCPSVDDSADILSIPRDTVKTRMFYARKKLAELVHEIKAAHDLV